MRRRTQGGDKWNQGWDASKWDGKGWDNSKHDSKGGHGPSQSNQNTYNGQNGHTPWNGGGWNGAPLRAGTWTALHRVVHSREVHSRDRSFCVHPCLVARTTLIGFRQETLVSVPPPGSGNLGPRRVCYVTGCWCAHVGFSSQHCKTFAGGDKHGKDEGWNGKDGGWNGGDNWNGGDKWNGGDNWSGGGDGHGSAPQLMRWCLSSGCVSAATSLAIHLGGCRESCPVQRRPKASS